MVWVVYNKIQIAALDRNVSTQETGATRTYFIIISTWIDFNIRSTSFSLLLVMELHFLTMLRVLRVMRLIECRFWGVIVASREQLFSVPTAKSCTRKTKQELTSIPPRQQLNTQSCTTSGIYCVLWNKCTSPKLNQNASELCLRCTPVRLWSRDWLFWALLIPSVSEVL
jgi:hypothetical protein